MDIGLKQEQRLHLGLKLTLQLQQAIKLLQLSRFELENEITKELMENPVLEETLTPGGTQGMTRTLAQPGNEKTEQPAKPDEKPESGEGREPTDDQFDWEKYFNGYAGGRPEGVFGRAVPDDIPNQDKRLHTRTDLREHLTWQLRLSDFNEDERSIGLFIIESLNEDGLLEKGDPGEDVTDWIATSTESTRDKVELVLGRIQQFDPVGVGSRNVRECLLIQAKTFLPSNKLVLDILSQHYELFSAMKFGAISKITGADEETVREAVRAIAHLETKPGRNYSQAEPHYVIPDVYIEKIGDEYKIRLNEEGLPRVRINGYYRKYLKSHRKDEAAKFIREKLNSAAWFVNSMEQRRRTIYKVVEAILDHQRGFFDHGVEHLKPMCLRDIADKTGMHESTVSRVTANKYIHTSQGLLEMKYFFNNGLGTADGNDMASKTVRLKLERILQEQVKNGKTPSDRELVAMLARDGIKIARRTVAKYRNQLGIMSSSKRRRML